MVYHGMHCALFCNYVLSCHSLILYGNQIARLATSLFLPSTTALTSLVNFWLPVRVQLASCRAVLLESRYPRRGILPPAKGAAEGAGHCPGAGAGRCLSRQAHPPGQTPPLCKESVGCCLSRFARLSSFPLCLHTLVLASPQVSRNPALSSSGDWAGASTSAPPLPPKPSPNNASLITRRARGVSVICSPSP